LAIYAGIYDTFIKYAGIMLQYRHEPEYSFEGKRRLQ
jgi:hypothetical protein